MNINNEEITKEFDLKFNDMEKIDESKKRMRTAVLYTVAIIMFLCVLAGTIVSIKNYFDAKKIHDNQNNVPVVTLKKNS